MTRMTMRGLLTAQAMSLRTMIGFRLSAICFGDWGRRSLQGSSVGIDSPRQSIAEIQQTLNGIGLDELEFRCQFNARQHFSQGTIGDFQVSGKLRRAIAGGSFDDVESDGNSRALDLRSQVVQLLSGQSPSQAIDPHNELSHLRPEAQVLWIPHNRRLVRISWPI